MPSEALLFWLVLLGFLLVENLAFIEPGHEILKVSRRGKLHYPAAARLEFGVKEALFLNPLNLFDRHVVTSNVTGITAPHDYLSMARHIRFTAKNLQPLVWIGYAYLAVIAVAAFMTFRFSFEVVVLPFLSGHFLFWLLAIFTLVLSAKNLALKRSSLIGLSIECLLVPAYVVNLSKIVLRQQRISLGALAIGVRSCKKCASPDERELLIYQMNSRLHDLQLKSNNPVEIAQLEELQKCLMT